MMTHIYLICLTIIRLKAALCIQVFHMDSHF